MTDDATKAPEGSPGSLRPSDCVPTEGLLLPCPFCGSAAEILSRHGTAVCCTNDQCIIHTDVPIPFNDYGHFEAAVAAWNRRAVTTTASSVSTSAASAPPLPLEGREALRARAERAENRIVELATLFGVPRWRSLPERLEKPSRSPSV